MQVDCSISGDIIIRVLEHRSSGGGYIKLTFLNKIGGIESVLISTSQASVRHHPALDAPHAFVTQAAWPTSYLQQLKLLHLHTHA